MWKDNRIAQLLGVRFPIIQAPMANIATARLVAAVSNAGGLGSLGAAYMQPLEIKKAIAEIRDLTEKPFAVNLFIPTSSQVETELIQGASHALQPFFKELSLPTQVIDIKQMPDFQEQMEVILSERVPVFSFTFGIPSLPLIQALKQHKTLLIGTATTLEEALLLEKSGIDAIVAQGMEAGGHRATFLDTRFDALLSLHSLLLLLHGRCTLPLIAAGGIMNGAGIATALALGAAGAQLGTLFLASPECSTPNVYKKALLHSGEAKTTLTQVFSGRLARVVKNRFVSEMEERQAPIAPFPYQHLLTKGIRLAAAKAERSDLLALYAGQGFPLTSNLPAAEIVPLLVEQTVFSVQKCASVLN